jgi:uncharacterized protein (TIGR02466 family)
VIQARLTNVEGGSLPGAELFELFPTPLLTYRWPESEALNHELEGVILGKMEEARGRSLWSGSNIGGWHSPKDLHIWPQPCIARLSERIHALVREMVARCVPDPLPEHFENWAFHAWANVSSRGAKNASHVHSHEKMTIWSGIYYVDSGTDPADNDAGGLTRFEDRSGVPREIIRNHDPFARDFSVQPQPGLMVLFPSTLWHRVEPFLGSGRRITIAFNLTHRDFIIPDYSTAETSPAVGFRSWMWKNFRGIMLPASAIKSRIRKPFRPLSPGPRRGASDGEYPRPLR